MEPIQVHFTWSLTLIVVAAGLKKKSPILTLATLEARTGGEHIRTQVARPAKTRWDSRPPGVRLGMFFMKFVRLFTVFRCGFDRSKVDYGFPPEPGSPDADPQLLARGARTWKL